MKSLSVKKDGQVVMSLNYSSVLTDGEACSLAYVLLKEIAAVDDFEIPGDFGEIVTNCNFKEVAHNLAGL